MKVVILIFALLFISATSKAQDEELPNSVIDSTFLYEVEVKMEPEKVFHAEPLFIDLIRDLGARKGEKEWNVGLGIQDNLRYDSYIGLVEYEFAPINRLGLEIELPFTFYYHNQVRIDTTFTPTSIPASRPSSKLNAIKTAAQWSFFISQRYKTTLALGYINELEMPVFKQYKNSSLFIGNVYNPFFIAAKRLGNNFHALVYTGPMIHQHFESKHFKTIWQINTNFHYMITGTRNFIGLEINKEISSPDFDVTLRPQMRVAISHNFLIGIVGGIPIYRENARFSSFIRLIYEPKNRH